MKKYICPKCGMAYDKPGKCTMDGTVLVKAEDNIISGNNHNNSINKNHNHHIKDNHNNHAHHEGMAENFRKRFIISLIITVPVLILSPMIQHFFNFNIKFPGSKYILWALSSFIYFYGGWPFLKGIAGEINKKQPGMMTLIAVAISAAYIYSAAVVLGLKGSSFFWELVTLIDIMLLGHWIEMKSIIGASKALEKLAKLLPDAAHILKNNIIEDISISKLNKGDNILIKAGEKFPADGIIKKGTGYIDESILTGESKPVRKKQGDKVIGGSVNGDSVFEAEVTETGENSYLNKVINLVKEAQDSKSKTQRIADTSAKWLTIIAITVGTITFIFWFSANKDIAFAIERMASVMVIACPHALGLAIPLVTAVSTSLSAKNGLLIKNRTAFENSGKITTVVFDKTGTLTEGKFGVIAVIAYNADYDEKKIMEFSSALEKRSEHPIAKGIIEKTKNLKAESNIDVKDFRILKGEGVEGKINSQTVKLVSRKYLEKNKIEIPDAQNNNIGTAVYLVVDNESAGSIVLADKIRSESYEAVNKLKKSGIKCWMLTGDNKEIAEKVFSELELDGFFAEVLPDQKQTKIKELQDKGEFVAMTGDGINDAPALAQADVGIAIGSGTDIAAETADIILINNNPKDVISLINFGKATYSKMIQNLFWATGYNIIAIPLAAGVLYNKGIIISPAAGAALMTLSTVIVAINAKFLKVKK